MTNDEWELDGYLSLVSIVKMTLVQLHFGSIVINWAKARNLFAITIHQLKLEAIDESIGTLKSEFLTRNFEL